MSDRQTSSVVSRGGKSSPAGANGLSKNLVHVSGKSGLTSSEDCHWVQCNKCDRWELFENSGISGTFDETRVNEMKFECRFCAVDVNSGSMDARIVGLEKHFAQVMKLLDSGMDKKIKTLEEKLVKLESRIDACFGTGDVAVEVLWRREACESFVAGKMNEAAVDLESKVVLCDVKCEDRTDQVTKQVNELSDRITAFEVKSRTWRTIGSRLWVLLLQLVLGVCLKLVMCGR